MFGGAERKQIAGIIMRAEISSLNNGVSIFETLESYSDELKKDSKSVSLSLREAARKLEASQKRWDVYKKYLDDDILRLLKISEEKNIPAGDIFAKYAPVKTIAEDNIAAVKKGLKTPIIMFVILASIFSFVVKNFAVINSVSDEKLSPTAMFIMNDYLLITGTMLAILIYLFFFIPEKVPLLKPVFKKLESLLILSTLDTMFSVGYSSSAVTPILVKQFQLKAKKRMAGNVSDLINILKNNNVVDAIEGADIKIGIENADFQKTIADVLKNRLKTIETLQKETGKIMDNISTILTAVPVVLALYVFGEVMAIVTNQIGG